MKTSLAVVIALAALVLSGCNGGDLSTNMDFATPERMDNGLVVILPGIEGEGPCSYGIRQGLVNAGVKYAIVIYRWGNPVPVAGMFLNETDVEGNRRAGERVAEFVMNYQEFHPGKPVFLIGHSGGGGVSVFAAEALPRERRVEGLVLLSASISTGYDLGNALARCRYGILNYHSSADSILVVGTSMMGNVDGEHGPGAGALGFDHSYGGLFQLPWNEDMRDSGNWGGHLDSTSDKFITRYIAPWIAATGWPAGR
jgi:hypothetical protein